MNWSFFAVGATGVLIGARFRIPALLAASCATVVASVTSTQLLGFSDQCTIFATLYLVLTLQGTYLIGLLCAILLHRLGRRSRPLRKVVDADSADGRSILPASYDD
ncbi:hypothetical protein [Sinorhizobium sp. BJ1]|uniref:hypothetical protein n=1 Tax=Sinorhizobium sp. BJ1 TaxID=2035455 RepID=UPI001FDEE020|nr:hypothetical protein [Sinorhizobium sp. BJ1]